MPFCTGKISSISAFSWQKKKVQEDQTYGLISRSIKLATKTLFARRLLGETVAFSNSIQQVRLACPQSSQLVGQKAWQSK
jgi:hypothetical protein